MPTLSDVLYGIAVADAIGNPLEFRAAIKPTTFNAAVSRPVLNVSDDTQMSLFCAEALFRAKGNVQLLPHEFSAAYSRWYSTQRHGEVNCTGRHGLLQFSSLYCVESPGGTCMSALRAIAMGQDVRNDSKGNGTVMRCAPIAFWAKKNKIPIAAALEAATLDANTTHKHPYAAECSRALVLIYLRALAGEDIGEATINSVITLHSENILSVHVGDLLLRAVSVDFSEFKMRGSTTARGSLFDGGWVAEEALALALCAVHSSSTWMEAVRLATTINGDSDTVGGIAGGLAVACGMNPDPEHVKRLNVLDALNFVESHYQ